jgi:hypothetical protein
MKKTALAVVAVFFMAVLSGYAGTKPRIAPPPPRVDVVPDSPTPYHVWIAGYWKWAGVNYVWVEGRWVKPKPGKAWVPGKWVKKGSPQEEVRAGPSSLTSARGRSYSRSRASSGSGNDVLTIQPAARRGIPGKDHG